MPAREVALLDGRGERLKKTLEEGIAGLLRELAGAAFDDTAAGLLVFAKDEAQAFQARLQARQRVLAGVEGKARGLMRRLDSSSNSVVLSAERQRICD